MMNKENMYLKEIEFDTIYDDEMTKKYHQINSHDYKKMIRVEKVEKKKGIIIGDCYKCDGTYREGSKGGSGLFEVDYGEPPTFSRNKTVQFWKVSIGMNETVLVPKNTVEEFRYSQEVESSELNDGYDEFREKLFGCPEYQSENRKGRIIRNFDSIF